MNDITMKVKASFDESSQQKLNDKLKSYNLGKEFNYAVAVLKVSINSNEQRQIDKLTLNIETKIQYITPFVTKELAEAYCNELSEINMLRIFLEVKDGRVFINNNYWNIEGEHGSIRMTDKGVTVTGEVKLGDSDSEKEDLKLTNDFLDTLSESIMNKLKGKGLNKFQ